MSSPSQKQFLALAIPNMMAGMSVPITELVDIAYLGHLDSVTPLSGVILATVIFDFVFWSFSFLRMGTTGLVAQAHGRGDREEQAALLWRAVLLGALIGIIITLLQKPIGDISFAILAGDAPVETAGRDYYNAHIWGAFPMMIDLAIIGWLLGQGRSGTVWILHLVWQLSNIILNYIFIIKLGWGAWGAGLGTTIAEIIAFIAGLIAVYHCWGGVPRFDKDRIRNWERLKELLTLNSAIMLRTFLIMSVLAAFTNISATFGTVALAANALMMKLFVFFAYIADGFAIALETLAGQSAGRRNKNKLNRSFRLAMRWSVGSALIFIGFYVAAADWVLLLLTEHHEVIEAAMPYRYWMCAVLLVGSFAFIYDGLFYGLAKPKLLFYSMAAAGTAYAPFAYYAWKEQNTTWLWIAFLCFMLVRSFSLIRPARKALQ